MSKFRTFFQKTLSSITIFTVLFFNFSPTVSAEETATPTPAGPQQPVGVQSPVGPQVQTGVVEPTGPQEPVGKQEPEVYAQIEAQKAAQSAQTAQQSAATVQSAEVKSTNQATGLASNNSSAVNKADGSTVSINNSADLQNGVNLNLGTGQNQLTSNNTVGLLDTGDITGSVNVLNLANTNLAPGSSMGSQTVYPGSINQLSLTPATNRVLLGNTETGPNSANSNIFNQGQDITVVQNNNANLNNDININAVSGGNQVASNTIVGDILTGSINLGVNVINLLNSMAPSTLLNIDTWNVMGNFVGDIALNGDLQNQITGPESRNQNSVDLANAANLTVTNNSAANNLFDFDLNTGNNKVTENSKIGRVETGSTNSRSAANNIANQTSPILYIFNVLGNWTGQLLGLVPGQVIVNANNTGTGPDSVNSNTTNLGTESSATINNTANANNRIRIFADTGNNNVSRNTSVGSLSTGAINVLTGVTNIANSLEKLTIRVINIFGDFKGNIVDYLKPKQVTAKTEEVTLAESEQTVSYPQAPTAVTNLIETILPKGGGEIKKAGISKAPIAKGTLSWATPAVKPFTDYSQGSTFTSSKVSAADSVADAIYGKPVKNWLLVKYRYLVMSLAAASGLWLLFEILAVQAKKRV